MCGGVGTQWVWGGVGWDGSEGWQGREREGVGEVGMRWEGKQYIVFRGYLAKVLVLCLFLPNCIYLIVFL